MTRVGRYQTMSSIKPISLLLVWLGVLCLRAWASFFLAFVGVVCVRSGVAALRAGETGSGAFIGGCGAACLVVSFVHFYRVSRQLGALKASDDAA